jgi:two-component system, LytTR family, sensor kinase
MDPEQLAETLRGETRGFAAEPPGSDRRREPGIGLRNIDERLRQVYGDAYGLIVETAPGAGTKVRVRASGLRVCRAGGLLRRLDR